MAAVHLEDFFKPFEQKPLIASIDYSDAEKYIKAADAFSRSSNHCVYIIDYKKRGFLYVSDNPLFLCGETASAVLKSGYQFYFRHVPAEDLDMLLEINEAGFAFYHNIPKFDRLSYSISYDFHLLHTKETAILINHKLTPLALDANHNLWLGLCAVTHSSNKNSGNIFISNKDGSELYEYNLKDKQWVKKQRVLLSIREKEIISLAMRGFSIDEIADKLYITIETVKFHRKNVFRKLHVKNISEAISHAINHNIL